MIRKVTRIPSKYFYRLLEKDLSPKDRKIILNLKEAQNQYPKLTYNKFMLFWAIYDRHIYYQGETL